MSSWEFLMNVITYQCNFDDFYLYWDEIFFMNKYNDQIYSFLERMSYIILSKNKIKEMIILLSSLKNFLIQIVLLISSSIYNVHFYIHSIVIIIKSLNKYSLHLNINYYIIDEFLQHIEWIFVSYVIHSFQIKK